MKSLVFVSFVTTIIILLLPKESVSTIMSRRALQDIYNELNNGLTFVKRKIYRYGYKGEICLEDPIQRCSCIEILYEIKDLKPGMPTIDEQDIRTKRRAASKHYHPDKVNGLDEEVFNFLNICAEKLINPKIRKYYLEELQFCLQSCEKRQYDDGLCRNLVEDLNNRVITEGKVVPVIPFPNREFEKGMETLHVFLDNSGSMADKSRQIVTHHNRINEDNLDSHVLDIWSAQDGLTFLWEFIWDSMKNNDCADCEIIIVTDGEDNMSTGLFHGPTGFDELMLKLKERNQPLPRVYVYCDECTYEIGKYYQELSLGAGGYFCQDDNVDECCDIINSPHCDRVKLEKMYKAKYRELSEAGDIRLLPWVNKNEL
ncbi:unnamed protein product [Rotaria magnacalcarata]|uniref:Uncharacterized protein n=5 Tax=Rotaria magnacalcarata TaxID=392030 RepID=A0A815RZB1_9BILA|nr:unnamed protein product [Rotaria magnacalcarata]